MELTVGFDGGAQPPSRSAPESRHEPGPDQLSTLEHLIRTSPTLQEAARAAASEAAREESRAFLRQLERDLRAARIEDRAAALETLQSAAEAVASASQEMEVIANEASVRGEETASQFQAASAEAIKSLQQAASALERAVEVMAPWGEEQMKRLRGLTDRVLDEVRDAARAASWRPWAMATTYALVLTLAMWLLRPGWTMSPAQRRAERVGETVIRAYEAASPARRAEMRRVMGWPDLLPADTAGRTRSR